MSKAGSWSDTPSSAADNGQDVAVGFSTRARVSLPVKGGIDVRLAHQNQQRGTPLTTPLINCHSGDLI